MMLCAIVSPSISTNLYNAIGFAWLTTGWGLLLIVLYTPCAWFLWRYHSAEPKAKQ